MTFTAKSSGSVRAVYQGLCAGGQAAVGSSLSGPVVLGISASRGQGGSGSSDTAIEGVSGARGSSAGLLAATGVDSQTELFGLLGVGMVAVGGLSLIVHRRRVQA